MISHRYSDIFIPVNRYLGGLGPEGRRLLAALEGGLLAALVAAVAFYLA